MAFHKKQSEGKFWLCCLIIGKNLFDGVLDDIITEDRALNEQLLDDLINAVP